MTRNSTLSAFLCALGFLLLACGAHAEILSPPTISGSYAIGGSLAGNGSCTTTNLGGSTANTNNTASLTGLGQIGPYSFSVTASIIRGTSSTTAWANGVCFPTEDAIRMQSTRAPTTANGADGPGYGHYQFDFSQGVKALGFKINGLDNGDYVELFAYNGVTQVAVLQSYITPDAGLTYYVPFVNRLTGGATDSNAVGYSSPASSGVLNLVLDFPLAITVTRVVARYGKTGTNTASATSYFNDFKWDVETKFRVRKISSGGTGTFGFSGSTNLAATPTSITTASSGVAAPASPAAINVTTSSSDVTVTESATAGYALSGFACVDANGASTGNPASFGSFVAATRVGTVAAANVRAGADITCTFTNTLIPPSMSIVKTYALVKAPGNTHAQAEAGDTINYSYAVSNTGGQIIYNVEVSDIHSGSGSFADPSHTTLSDNGTIGDSPDSNPDGTIWGTLSPQDALTFTSSYIVVQQDVDSQ